MQNISCEDFDSYSDYVKIFLECSLQEESTNIQVADNTINQRFASPKSQKILY